MTRQKFTQDNTGVPLIDQQVGLFTGVRDINGNKLKHNVVGLARAAQAQGLPVAPVTTGLARLSTLGVEDSDCATLTVKIMADNADAKVNDVYAALDMPSATLMGQVASALTR